MLIAVALFSQWLRKAIKLLYLRQLSLYYVWYRFFVTNTNQREVLWYGSKTSGDAKVPVSPAFV
jgi:hypothetical protein